MRGGDGVVEEVVLKRACDVYLVWWVAKEVPERDTNEKLERDD